MTLRKILSALVLLPLAALADEPPPIQQDALVRGFALPVVGRPDVLDGGRQRTRVDLSEANEFCLRNNAFEQAYFDGEATELAVDYRRGLGQGWEAGLLLPLLSQGGGVLDRVIESWHHFWGLPNAGRDEVPVNRYAYQYTRGGKPVLEVTQPNAGLGDLQLYVGRRLGEHLAARAMLKMPTGDSTHLAGNGAFGGAVWLDGEYRNDWLHWLTLYGSAGYSETATGQLLPQQQKHALPFGAFGFGIQFNPRWSLRAEAYVHDSPYSSSGLAALAHVAAPVALSLGYRIAPATRLSLGFQEKASTYASPDFGIFASLTFD